MPKFLIVGSGEGPIATSQYIFNGGLWIPKNTSLQNVGSTDAGSFVFCSGAFFVASGSNTWHRFNIIELS